MLIAGSFPPQLKSNRDLSIMAPTTSNSLSRRSLFSRGALALGGAIALPCASLLSETPALAAPEQPGAKLPLRIIVVDSLGDAQQILGRLVKGEDFAAIAGERSIDPTADAGGYLGKLDPETLRPELREALKGLEPGRFTSVVKIPEGYAIVKIDPDHAAGTLGDNPTSLLALTGPGAVRYGPDIDGFGESFAVFTHFQDQGAVGPWDLTPVSAAEVHHRSVASGIRQLNEMLTNNLEVTSPETAMHTRYLLAQLYAFRGEMALAIEQWTNCYRLAQTSDPGKIHYLEEVLGIAHYHKAEMDNGIYTAPGERCLFPMSPELRYPQPADSEKAREYFLKYLQNAPSDLEAKWLLNLSCMSLGQYPAGIPNEHRIPLASFHSPQSVGRFVDVAAESGLSVFSDAGGVILDDFENRGLFDVVLSEMGDQNPTDPLRYFHNNGNGTFSNRTEQAGLKGVLGGLNVIQADYNNDGNLDILVLRGAWLSPQPMSLLRGNGDGTFTDVTRQAGLTHLVATQTAVWADINNDGFLDLFVGNEQGPSFLFLNKGDGTFEDISAPAGVDQIAFTKGVVAGDFDNDGYVDFYVTNLSEGNFLFKNQHDNTFKEVSGAAGVRDPMAKSFATWFFDYDNDGWLDLFVTSYYAGSVDENMRSYLGLPANAVTLKLYKNSRDGRFEDVTRAVGLDKVFMPMGANFGDVDNDGFLDIYLGTGNPSYGSLVPNVLLRNDGGTQFVDITASSGTGELHKGHAVAFADMTNSGHQDILTVIGGATLGDRHAFRYFKNPGNHNNWIRVKLVGVKSNRSAIGARIKVTVENSGRGRRSIYRTVGSGGSFGANPLEQHIGLGPQAHIVEIEVGWPASNARQVFLNLDVDQCIEIKEFAGDYTRLVRPKLAHGAPLSARR